MVSLKAIAFLVVCQAFLCTCTETADKAEIFWDDLRVHFSPLGSLNGFFKLPRMKIEAVTDGYTSPPEEPVTNGVMCPNEDPSVCVLFDDMGVIAGMQMGILQSDVESTEFIFEDHKEFVPTVRFGYDIFLTTVFFVEQDVLKSGGRSLRDLETNGTGTGLWVQNGPVGSELFEVPRLEVDMIQTAYSLENCVPGMGVHYYYNISEGMSCQDFEPIFALYHNSEMIGFGFQNNGKPTPISKTWYEAVPAAAIKPTIPNAPECLVDWAKEFGIISLHVYFVDKPWAIQCTDA